jgi:hypothetical protein
MATDVRIIRNRRKVEAIIGNAQRMIDLEREHGGFQEYLRSKGDDFGGLVKDLRKNVKFFGGRGRLLFRVCGRREGAGPRRVHAGTRIGRGLISWACLRKPAQLKRSGLSPRVVWRER